MAPLLIIFLLHVSHFTIKFNGMMSDNNNNNDGKNDSKVSWLILSENIEKNVNRASSYRLAYRYVASSANNNNNDNVDVNITIMTNPSCCFVMDFDLPVTVYRVVQR